MLAADEGYLAILDVGSIGSRDSTVIVFRDPVDSVLLEIEADNPVAMVNMSHYHPLEPLTQTAQEKFLEALQAAQEHLIPELKGLQEKVRGHEAVGHRGQQRHAGH